MTNRRKFMAILGGGVVLAAGAGGVWASTRDPVRARAPWQTAGGETDPRRRALSYAILAPNPHNRQPWVADLSVEDEITLTCDLERRLPHTDPFDRQITIGLGCFLELLTQSAAQDGYAADVALFPEGEPHPRLDGRPVARVRFVQATAQPKDPLFAHVLDRRSNKEAFDASRTAGSDSLVKIAGAAHVVKVGHTNDPARASALRARAWAAMETEMATPRTLKESIDLIRVGRAEIEANPDGIDLAGPLMEALSAAGMLSREDMLDTTSTAFQEQMSAMREPFDTATAFLWTTTPGNKRSDQIAAGRDHVRINLAATAQGISLHPISQALQEYEEMKPHFDGLRQALNIPPEETLQMFVRLGYGPAAKPSPRWPYETRIRTA